jgi:hypothetical protein
MAAMLGFAIGFVFGGGSTVWEFFRRVRWSWSGGGGESADWGEPLFYMLLLGAPLGLLLGAGAFVLTALVQWFRQKQG